MHKVFKEPWFINFAVGGCFGDWRYTASYINWCAPLIAMSMVSYGNVEKAKSNILRLLYDDAPKSLSARAVAIAEARDKEFVLRLLRDLEKKKIVRNATKDFSRKSSWVMTEQAYKKYKELL